jgi:hypothetical protein
MLCLSETLSQQGTATSVPLRDPGCLLETVGGCASLLSAFFTVDQKFLHVSREALSFVLPGECPGPRLTPGPGCRFAPVADWQWVWLLPPWADCPPADFLLCALYYDEPSEESPGQILACYAAVR